MNKMEKFFSWVLDHFWTSFLIYFLAIGALFGGLLYIALHFIDKYW